MEIAYNACDLIEYVIGNKTSNFMQAEYVYVGSYFCDLYMLSVAKEKWREVITYIGNAGKKIVLVIPTPSQRNLEKLKSLVSFLVSEYSDVIREVVINDYGMFRWVKNRDIKLPIWCGRLLSKELRDPRYPERIQGNKLADWVRNELFEGVNIIGVELDTPYKVEPSDSLQVAFHTPLNYVTMGRYCEIGSIERPLTDKFRLWSGCNRTCMKYWNRYENDEACFLKFGKAVYAYNISNCNNGNRTIYNGIYDFINKN